MARKSNFPRPILPFDIWGPVPANQPPRNDEYNEELNEELRQSNCRVPQLMSVLLTEFMSALDMFSVFVEIDFVVID